MNDEDEKDDEGEVDKDSVMARFSMLDGNILEKMENGRSQHCAVYKTFLFLTLRYITGFKKWQRMSERVTCLIEEMEDRDGDVEDIKHEILGTKCWTDSDEAFAVTLLANNLKFWIARHNNEDGQVEKACQKFTNVTKSGTSGQPKTACGWSPQGVMYYNNRIMTIQSKRKMDDRFDVDLIQSTRVQRPRYRETPQPKRQEIVVPFIDSAELDNL